jgi:hypothetical protein
MSIPASPPIPPMTLPSEAPTVAAGRPLPWAPLAPVVCAIHCAATPLLAVVAPSLAPGPVVEWLLLGVTVGIALVALGWGFRHHGQRHPLLWAATGLVAWGISLAGGFAPLAEEATTIFATLIVAGALVWNGRLRCSVPTCSTGCSHSES